jgi:hypothetical protein
MACGSGSCAFPAPRSSLPVTRLDLRGFPPEIRLRLPALRLRDGARPSWASLLSRSGRHRCRPHPSAPVGGFPPPPLGFVGRFARSPPSTSSPVSAFPRCCHRFGDELPLISRSDLTVSHGPAGFLHQSPGFSPDFPSPFRVTEDSRACCIPLPIMGFDVFPPIDRVAAGPIGESIAGPAAAGHLDRGFPASFRTPRRTFPPRGPHRVTTARSARWSVLAPTVCTMRDSLSSLGLSPSRLPPRPNRVPSRSWRSHPCGWIAPVPCRRPCGNQRSGLGLRRRGG